MSNSIKVYWNSLEARERLVLSWGALIVGCIFFYALLWQPWQQSLSFMEQSVSSMRVNAQWMEQRVQDMKGGIESTSSTPKRGADQSLTSLIERTATQAKVADAIQQIVPDPVTGQVRVVLEGADFNQWVLWVDNLYKNYGVDISQLNVEKEDEKPNLAEIRLSFSR